MTSRDTLLAISLVLCFGLAIAISSGKLGGLSDIEMRVRASEPVNLKN